MKKNNTLLLVNNLELVQSLKDRNDITFLFPLTDFCVGFSNTFHLNDIKIDAYIYLNRLFTSDDIEKVKNILLNLPSNIKGIVFDDIGVLNILLSANIKITKILFLSHFNCNYESINAYLKYVDSVVVSSDITIEEIDTILKKAAKPLVLYTFGHVSIMYSRRSLLTNYNKYFSKNVPKVSLLEEGISHQKFKIIENTYGTVIYTEKPFNALSLRNKQNVLYNFINTVFLSNNEIIEIINSNDNLESIYPYKYLSENKTIVKIKGDKND